MCAAINITKLKSSWTKYDAVQVINVVSSEEEIRKYLEKEKGIDPPILKNFLGVNRLTDSIPSFWIELQKYPEQKRLFSLLAAVFTHHENIKKFAEASSGDMKGVFKMESHAKQNTNLRSALVEGGAAPTSSRSKEEVAYDFSPLFKSGVGKLFRQLLEQRLLKIGWDGKDFEGISKKFDFHKALSISHSQFIAWTNGESLSESQLTINLELLKSKYSSFSAFKVNQWLNSWDDIHFSQDEQRRKPAPFFLMFKMDARLLKRLSDVHRRKADVSRFNDASVQRTHSESRSDEIRNYRDYGFPLSTISKPQRDSETHKDLKMPGILATAIIANIMAPATERGKKTLSEFDAITVTEQDSDFPKISIADRVFESNWNPELKPIEIIDGQHRLWAFDESEELNGEYELPVIAYFDLDRAWQAYLFYTINIKPVKINTSLGYDLYPLLRTQKWLESSKEGLMFYRENRAQELVEALWSYKESPWMNRIKMLGEGAGNVSQAAFIRALTSSFLKKSTEQTHWGMGGLFSDELKNGSKNQVLNWNRSQQAGFLILLWDVIRVELDSFLDDEDSLKDEPKWAKQIRELEPNHPKDEHPAFRSKLSFLSSDQGVRGISLFANDFFFVLARQADWDLNELVWDDDLDDKTIRPESIDKAINLFKNNRLYSVMQSFAKEAVKADWRTPSAIADSDTAVRLIQSTYKGSSGYKEVWRLLIGVFLESRDNLLKQVTSEIAELDN